MYEDKLSRAQQERLTEIERAARAAWQKPTISYSAVRWPYTYAVDFICTYPHLIPQVIRDTLGEPRDRAAASPSIRHWALALDVPPEAVAAVLADAYLEKENIPLEQANQERAKLALSE